MNSETYVFTSSKGRNMKGKLNCEYMYVLPGGKLKRLCEVAYSKLQSVPGVKLVL